MIRLLSAAVVLAIAVGVLVSRTPEPLMRLDGFERVADSGELARRHVTPSPSPSPSPSASPVPSPVPRRVVPSSSASGPAGTVPGSVAEVQALIRRELGERFISIAACETGGWDPRIIWGPKTGRAGERGPLQVHPGHFDTRWGPNPIGPRLGFTFDQMFTPVHNVRVAKAIYDSQGLQAWRNCL